MFVLLVRHAIAKEAEEFAKTGLADDFRPLTEKGRLRMRKQLLGLKNQVEKVHWIASSPLVRAKQTADLVADAYPSAQRTILNSLALGGNVTGTLSYLNEHSTDSTIVLVGHEPNLGELATWLLTGVLDTWLPLKKGGACLLEFRDKIAAGEADLCWVLTPKQLRGLA